MRYVVVELLDEDGEWIPWSLAAPEENPEEQQLALDVVRTRYPKNEFRLSTYLRLVPEVRR